MVGGGVEPYTSSRKQSNLNAPKLQIFSRRGERVKAKAKEGADGVE